MSSFPTTLLSLTGTRAEIARFESFGLSFQTLGISNVNPAGLMSTLRMGSVCALKAKARMGSKFIECL